ncbi:hypothetical protein AHF37_06855 [Paragonimus kellicotti]|nr:hypothetical protein AHF37_06855 [Paragonimus kellicotti]
MLYETLMTESIELNAVIHAYGREGQLVLQTPQLILPISDNSGQVRQILLVTERERNHWRTALETAVYQVKQGLANKNSNNMSCGVLVSTFDGLSEKRTNVEQCSPRTTHSEMNELLKKYQYVSYHVWIEVDSYAQFEELARTRVVSHQPNPEWNQRLRAPIYNRRDYGTQYIQSPSDPKNYSGAYKSKDLQVPKIVVACTDEIERRGLREVGIYRVCGSNNDIQAIKELIDQGSCRVNRIVIIICKHYLIGYHVWIEVDSYAQFEELARTRVVSHQPNPEWNQVSCVEKLRLNVGLNMLIYGSPFIYGLQMIVRAHLQVIF